MTSSEPARSPSTAPSAELGTAQLRVLSHPTRLAFLRRLRTHGAATARMLGREFELDSGAASYHLRRLAQCGLIHEEPDRGTRRERWWSATTDSSQFDPAQHDDDTSRAYLGVTVLAAAAELQSVAARVPGATADWMADSIFLDNRLQLNDADAAELRAEALALMARYRERAGCDADADRGAPLVVQMQLYRRP